MHWSASFLSPFELSLYLNEIDICIDLSLRPRAEFADGRISHWCSVRYAHISAQFFGSFELVAEIRRIFVIIAVVSSLMFLIF